MSFFRAKSKTLSCHSYTCEFYRRHMEDVPQDVHTQQNPKKKYHCERFHGVSVDSASKNSGKCLAFVV